MATSIQPGHAAGEDRTAMGVVAGGAGMKTLAGLGVAVLAILALVGIIPITLIAIAGIVFGVAMLFEGISIATEYQKIAQWLTETSAERIEIGGGTGVEIIVGLAAIAMGILALLGIAAPTLMPALIITGGAGLLLSAGSMQRLNDLHLATGGRSESARRLAHDAMTGGTITQTLGGIAAIVLGILSLVMLTGAEAESLGTFPQVGMLVLGIATAASGGALLGKSTMLYKSA
jgi:hypothetical protein